MMSIAYVFGDNRVGQCGISSGEDALSIPTAILSLDSDLIALATTNQDQTFVVLKNGEIYTSGANDNNELGRVGKRSLLQRVESLETFQIVGATLGDSFFSLVTKEGRILSWGKNDLGQLGNTTREEKDKPRLNTNLGECVVQNFSGSQHSIALTKSGKVLTYGGNRKGQLGDGQLTSSTVPIPLLQLRHRPVVAIACGENHSLALTSGGNLYAWGDNSQGQLGLSDTVNRLRPEIVKSLRAVKPCSIAAGKQHSIAITKTGIMFSFGSNGFGQCGIGTDTRLQTVPIVVEKLRDWFVLQVACGSSHTLILCKKNDKQAYIQNKVFVMGLNSSGQLGLGTTKNVFYPTMLPLSNEVNIVTVASGPLSYHSIVLSGEQCILQKNIPSLTYSIVLDAVNRFNTAYFAINATTTATTSKNASENKHKSSNEHEVYSHALNNLRELISCGFSSLSVLNASFLIETNLIGNHNNLCFDLKSVRDSYTLLFSTEHKNNLIVTTLSRATMYATDRLSECPFDDPETLSVFLIVLENPLLLRCKDFHVAIQRVF